MNTQIIKHLSDNDEVLKNIIQTIPPPEIISTQDVFYDLMSCVIEQQIHYRSTKKTFQKALEASNLQLLTLDNFSELEEKGLKQVKMSMNKYETLERVLTFFNENKLNWSEVSDENIRKILSKIKGIGAWTIDMILLYTLQRPKSLFKFFLPDNHHFMNLTSHQIGHLSR